MWQNLFLGREIGTGAGPLQLLDRRRCALRPRPWSRPWPSTSRRSTHGSIGLSGGQRQAVAIARAAGWGSGIVILDEPTAALGVQETAKVEELILGLRAEASASC